ncbi:acyltransferase [Rubrivirga marina]|uniref:acyltransferase n=1 Tax=Rubrivirga marina TaxID=1196024 RepID=UPI001FE4E657|nr:acyltransferase [Rubrivirga marina]
MTSIGDRVTITSGVKFITHDGSAWLVRDERGRRYVYNSIKIGNDVFVGVNTIILPGVEIGDRVIVAAGSVVTKSIPDGCIVAGVPARRIGEYAEYESFALNNFASEKDLSGYDYVSRVNMGLDIRGAKPLLG